MANNRKTGAGQCTANNQLFALDAGTGKPVTSFGKSGKVDMRIGLRDNGKDIYVSSTSPGIIYRDLIIMGCRVPDVYGAQPGYIRAYNCLTGKLVWTFHTVPLPGEPGYETWSKDAYKVVGGVNNWAGMSLDQKRGMVFLALGSPSYDFYGTDRKGENLYGNCVLALDAASGKHIWHFQTTNFLYIKANDAPDIITIIKGDQTKASSESPARSSVSSQLGTTERNAHADQYLNSTGYKTWKDPSGNPAITPPWGTLHALNLSTGEYEWQIPLGNDEARQAKGAPETGQEGKAGPIVTAGGLFSLVGRTIKSCVRLTNQPVNYFGRRPCLLWLMLRHAATKSMENNLSHCPLEGLPKILLDI